MTENFLTFRKYSDVGLATEIGEQLKANNIEYFIEDGNQIFDASLANNTLNPDVNLKLKAEDFSHAQTVLDDFYKHQTSIVDKEYYLYEFTDQELIEIISKPDEWGEFDYQLALTILAARGKEVTPETIELLNKERIRELSKPEVADNYSIYKGYFFALLGGIFAILFGYNLAYSKKTMRDGTQVYTYREGERKHGQRILLLGIICLIIWVGIIIYSKF